MREEKTGLNVETLNIFPTTIWTFDLSHLAEYFESWIAVIDEQKLADKKGHGRSSRNGWSGPKTLFEHEQFEALFMECEKAFTAALLSTGMPNEFGFALEAWANVHEKGGYNKLHIHGDSLLTGVFYLATPKGSGAISFIDPRPGSYFSSNFGRHKSSKKELQLEPAQGSLILFPSWLQHSVEPHMADASRYSIAVNAINQE